MQSTQSYSNRRIDFTMTSKRLRLLITNILIILNVAMAFRCDRRPYATTVQASPSDGRFKLTVLGITDDAYIPDQLYVVQITQTDNESRFSSFMISAEGEPKPDPRNPRRMVSQYPGEIRPINPTLVKFSDRCPYSVEQAAISLKSLVEVYWQAPSSGSGCVTLRAMVQENDDLWFEDGAPLSQKICEDMRQPDDVMPQVNSECNICDEAKYEVSFTGVWSRNTHDRFYPENDWLPRYSDLVGASHSADFILWSPGSLASEGLKELAEYANTSKFEAEIREKIGDGVRTLIKGKGHGYPKMSDPSYSFFRTDKVNHLFTVAVGIYPSPDWFLGVTRFELCQNDAWLPERELNLFPWDAGTDSGISYESANIVTYPQDSIRRVEMSSFDRNSPFFEMSMKDMHPFGKLHMKLVRTYHRDCGETTDEPTEEENEAGSNAPAEETKEPEEKQPEPEQPSRYHNTDIATGSFSGPTESHEEVDVDEETSEECPMTPWGEWSQCEGECEDGKIIGYKWRERYHLVDGIAVEKYDPNAKHGYRKEVSRYCKNTFDDFERNDCEEECLQAEENAEKRTMNLFNDYSKKRDLNTIS